jgi:uncharacterized protein (DUF433 family)
MDWRHRIEANTNVLQGKPCIRGTRISVALICERLSSGWDVATLLEAYPHLTALDIAAAKAFAAIAEHTDCGNPGRREQ